MGEKLKPTPTPGNVVRMNGILLRIGCGSCDRNCDHFKGKPGMQIASGKITNGYCMLVEFNKVTDPQVKIVDLSDDHVFDGQPTTVFCGETCEKD